MLMTLLVMMMAMEMMMMVMMMTMMMTTMMRMIGNDYIASMCERKHGFPERGRRMMVNVVGRNCIHILWRFAGAATNFQRRTYVYGKLIWGIYINNS